MISEEKIKQNIKLDIIVGLTKDYYDEQTHAFELFMYGYNVLFESENEFFEYYMNIKNGI